MNNFNDLNAIYGRDKEWREDIPQIPALFFKEDWSVRILPPFGGATVRFTVSTEALKKKDKWISVYLDMRNRLGHMDRPYWEVYPFKGDTERIYMEDVGELFRAIELGLEKLNG